MDWDGDCFLNNAPVIGNITNVLGALNPDLPGQVLTGFEDWPALQYNFRKSDFYANGIYPPPGPKELDAEVMAIFRAMTPSCRVDFNRDGFVDFFDFGDFQACFEGEFCPPYVNADFNLDGFVDFFDYDDFVAAFEVGC